MARVAADIVQHVARLAHLSLSAEERETFARQLDEVLSHAESILALDTDDVPPMTHAHVTSPLREDEPQASLSRERALEAAPDAEAGLFRVPRVLGG